MSVMSSEFNGSMQRYQDVALLKCKRVSKCEWHDYAGYLHNVWRLRIILPPAKQVKN